MPRGKTQDRSILAMALVGYEVEKKKIEDRIQEIRNKLGKVTAKVRGALTSNNDRPKRRKLSVAARKRIAQLQSELAATRRAKAELGISEQAIYSWRKQDAVDGGERSGLTSSDREASNRLLGAPPRAADPPEPLGDQT